MIKLFDENNCLINLSSSLFKHFSLECNHPTLPVLDEILSNTDKKICLVLLDGLGTAIRQEYPIESKDLNAHYLSKITSVFPPTTVAATTALLTDQYPMETGWLGWTEQFPEYERSVTMFPSTFEQEPKDKTPVSTYELLPFTNIFDKMKEKGIKCNLLQSFTLEDKNPDVFIKAVDDALKDNKFFYAYSCEPDSSLHRLGVGSEEVASIIKKLNDGVVRLSKNHPDTLFVVIADHGHKSIDFSPVNEHEDFYSLLRIKHYSGEARTAFFFVEKGKEEEFRKTATKHYGKHFYVLSKEEVINNHIFGYGTPCPRFESLLGDFLLISKDSSAFLQAYDKPNMISTHAGSTDEERYIDISVFNN